MMFAFVLAGALLPHTPSASPVPSETPASARLPATSPPAGPPSAGAPPANGSTGADAAPTSVAAPLGNGPSPLAIPPGAIAISNSGSTNFAGYTIVVRPDGNAVVEEAGATRSAVLPHPQTAWLFAKVRQAAPFSSLPAERCMKSVSFGSTTTIVYDGARTADLSCGGDATIRELRRTAAVVAARLGVTNQPRRRSLELRP